MHMGLATRELFHSPIAGALAWTETNVLPSGRLFLDVIKVCETMGGLTHELSADTGRDRIRRYQAYRH